MDVYESWMIVKRDAISEVQKVRAVRSILSPHTFVLDEHEISDLNSC